MHTACLRVIVAVPWGYLQLSIYLTLTHIRWTYKVLRQCSEPCALRHQCCKDRATSSTQKNSRHACAFETPHLQGTPGGSGSYSNHRISDSVPDSGDRAAGSCASGWFAKNAWKSSLSISRRWRPVAMASFWAASAAYRRPSCSSGTAAEAPPKRRAVPTGDVRERV